MAGVPVKMRWSLIFAFIGMVFWSPPGISAKIEHFTDKEGRVHISNESQAAPEKPGEVQTPGTPPSQMCPPGIPQGLSPLPGSPPPLQRQEMPDIEGKQPVPESDGEAQPAPPTAPPAQAPPGQED